MASPSVPKPKSRASSRAPSRDGSERNGPRDERRASQSQRGAADGEGDAAGGERIAKVMARAGVASRREVERLIEAGRVAVNGRRLDTPATLVTASDVILLDGAPIREAEPARLWRYHKPGGLVTTARDEQGRETIYDHLPSELPRLMPVGRLDLTSEGLLLLTNDGALKRRLELPSTGWIRKYRVRAHGRPTEAALEPLRRGLTVDGVRYRPMTVSLDRQQGANAWLTIGLSEGKNREIRNAMEAVGFPVSRLIRTGYGPFQLGNLPLGQVAEVPAKQLRELLNIAAESPEARARRAR